MRPFPKTTQLVSIQLVLEFKQWGPSGPSAVKTAHTVAQALEGPRGNLSVESSWALLGQEKGCS